MNSAIPNDSHTGLLSDSLKDNVCHLVQCKACGSVARADMRYCICGARLGEEHEADTMVVNRRTFRGYTLLRVAAVVTKILACIYLVLRLMTLEALPSEASLFVTGLAIVVAALPPFFMWIAGDVIRILLDIWSQVILSTSLQKADSRTHDE